MSDFLLEPDVLNKFTIQPLGAGGSFQADQNYLSQGAGNDQIETPPAAITVGSSRMYVADPVNNRIMVRSNVKPFIFVWKYDDLGAGDGQVSAPEGVAVDDNYLYIADTGNDRVQVFDKTILDGPTAFQFKFGATGAGNGQFSSPTRLAVDDDRIYVVDSGNARIQIFAKLTGVYLDQFNTFVTNPGDLFIDGERIFISDKTDDQINTYDRTTFSFLKSVGTTGVNDGEFDTPQGIFVDSAYLYVADNLNDRIQVFGKNSLSFVTKFGVAGLVPTSIGEMYRPMSVAKFGNTLMILTEEPFLAIWLTSLALTQITEPISFAAFFKGMHPEIQIPTEVTVSGDEVYVCDVAFNLLIVFDRLSGRRLRKVGTGPGFFSGGNRDIQGNFNGLEQVDVDADFVYSIQYGGTAGIGNISIFSRKTLAFITRFSEPGSTDGKTDKPNGIKVDDNYIYICDRLNDRIQIFDKSDYTFVDKFGTTGSGPSQFSGPRKIDIDDNYIYVADTGNNRIQIFDKTSPFAWKVSFGSSGTGEGQFDTIQGIAVEPATTPYGVGVLVYIADAGNYRVQIIFVEAGTFFSSFIEEFGLQGDKEMQFDDVSGIDVDADFIYVAERPIPYSPSANDRVQIFTKSRTVTANGDLVVADVDTAENQEVHNILTHDRGQLPSSPIVGISLEEVVYGQDDISIAQRINVELKNNRMGNKKASIEGGGIVVK